MLIIVTGTSCSGKTTIKNLFKEKYPETAVYDFDDIGVPENATKAWRQESTEKWVQKYLDGNPEKPFVLFGQVVLGEFFAAPSFDKVNNIHACLIDVDDEIRMQRLIARNTYGANQDMLNWSQWMRQHHKNPQHNTHVITEDCWEALDLETIHILSDWSQLRSHITLNNSNEAPPITASKIYRWIEDAQTE